MAPAGMMQRKTTTRSGSGDEDGERIAEAKEVRVEVDEEKLPVVSKVVETENIREIRTERNEEVGKRNSREKVGVEGGGHC